MDDLFACKFVHIYIYWVWVGVLGGRVSVGGWIGEVGVGVCMCVLMWVCEVEGGIHIHIHLLVTHCS